MGNNMERGFHQLPRVYLRDLRKKTDQRFRSLRKERVGDIGKDKIKPKGSNGTQLNSMNVSAYVISNPDFLDDLVKKHISQDRVRAWIREPTEEEDLKVEDSPKNIDDLGNLVQIDSDLKLIGNEDSSKADDFNVKPSKMFSKIAFRKNARPAKAKAKNSRADSTFAEYMLQKGDRHQKLLIANRRQLVFPFRYSSDELSELIETSLADVFFSEMESHLFPYTEISAEDINKVFIKMSGSLLGKYGFPMTELCYFLTTLKANYLEVEYHNYGHALSHAQSMFWILKKNPGVFTELEMKSLMIASIAHDVGHPGVNEAFLKNVHSGLQNMYDDPILENHHTQTCFLILQDIKSNVFCDLDTHDYKQVLDDIKHAILSTNVHRYRVQCERVRQIMDTGINMEKRSDRQSVKALMMMACDLCSSWKRWDEHRNIVWSLYREFFNQGDKELEFGLDPPPPMMRTNADNIPKYQISFMENTVLPICKLLDKVFPSFAPAAKSTKENLDCWKTYG